MGGDGAESCCGPCVVFKDEPRPPRWGAYEGVVMPDLDAGSGLRGGNLRPFSPTLGQQSAEQTRRKASRNQ